MLSRNGLIVLLALTAIPLWSQEASSGAQPAGEEGAIWSPMESSGAEPAGEEAPMITPAPLSDEGYSLTFASETPRTNYLRGGLSLGTAYDDNILPSSGHAVSDVTYSVWPSISLVQSRSRLAWDLSYNSGLTFHHHNGSINAVDHYLTLGLEYRLSPHVTLSLSNAFQKTSDLLNLPDQGVPASRPGGVYRANDSIVPPATARIGNFSDTEITYQFGPNAMIGAKGTFSGLWYPNRVNLSGLFDSTAGVGSGFYAHRLSGRHYVGVTYGFQRLLTHPGRVETQTQSMLLFYTLYLPPSLAVSLFAGPEHSDTHDGDLLLLRKWSPAAGGSLTWHGEHTSFIANYAHRISDGGGLSGAVASNRADASWRWQFAKTLTGDLGANYSTSSVLDSQSLPGIGGHAWSGTVSLQHPLGENLGVQFGYTRLHQSYSSVTAIANAPNRNNIWVSLSYQFARPLGR